MRLFVSSLSSSSVISNERTIYQIGGVADNSAFDNSIVINQALEDGYKILFPDTKTFYISNSILYDGTIEMEGTGTIRLAPNSLCYLIKPKTVGNTEYNILHELVDLRGLTFDADRYSGNDIRDYSGTWNETFWGFGMVFSNTRNVYLNDTTHWNAEAWNVCTLGNYNVESNGVYVDYSGESPINSDGFSGPNVRTSHVNLTVNHLRDDIVGIGNGNGTLGGNELGMNYYIDVEYAHVTGLMNLTSETASVLGFYPNTLKFDEIIIDDYETFSYYAIRIKNYWPGSRPDTYVKKIIVRNCTINLQGGNAIYDLYKMLLIEDVFCEELYIENCEVVDVRADGANFRPVVLLSDGAKECNTYVDNIFGHVKGDVTIYDGTVSTGHTYISNSNVTSDGTITQYAGIKPVTEL